MEKLEKGKKLDKGLNMICRAIVAVIYFFSDYDESSKCRIFRGFVTFGLFSILVYSGTFGAVTYFQKDHAFSILTIYFGGSALAWIIFCLCVVWGFFQASEGESELGAILLMVFIFGSVFVPMICSWICLICFTVSLIPLNFLVNCEWAVKVINESPRDLMELLLPILITLAPFVVLGMIFQFFVWLRKK